LHTKEGVVLGLINYEKRLAIFLAEGNSFLLKHFPNFGEFITLEA
jgi:hypothetical protein